MNENKAEPSECLVRRDARVLELAIEKLKKDAGILDIAVTENITIRIEQDINVKEGEMWMIYYREDRATSIRRITNIGGEL